MVLICQQSLSTLILVDVAASCCHICVKLTIRPPNHQKHSDKYELLSAQKSRLILFRLPIGKQAQLNSEPIKLNLRINPSPIFTFNNLHTFLTFIIFWPSFIAASAHLAAANDGFLCLTTFKSKWLNVNQIEEFDGCLWTNLLTSTSAFRCCF